VIQIQFSEP